MSFIRLHVLAEGQTEEGFVKQVLCPYLGTAPISTDVQLAGPGIGKRKIHRGGVLDYASVKWDLLRWMQHDHNVNARFTTMFDLYALPSDFPGFAAAARQSNPYDRVHALEQALADDIGYARFIPYIQLHEFEALVLADLEHQHAIARLVDEVQNDASARGNPEMINDGKDSAPSKRILREIPEYDKVNAGPLTVERIGIPRLRASCRHFDEWIRRLEGLTA